MEGPTRRDLRILAPVRRPPGAESGGGGAVLKIRERSVAKWRRAVVAEDEEDAIFEGWYSKNGKIEKE